MMPIIDGPYNMRQNQQKTVFNPSNHVYFNLNRDNNVVYNHCINSSALKMYMLNNKHIVKEGQSLDLHRLLDTNKVYLKDIFESDNETLQQQINHYNGIDHPFRIWWK